MPSARSKRNPACGNSRREWWLWFSALFVATLSALALALSSFPSLFRHSEHFYEIRPDQALGDPLLLLLFMAGLLYRHGRSDDNARAGGQNAGATRTQSNFRSLGIDPVTGLHTLAFIEQQLGKRLPARGAGIRR